MDSHYINGLGFSVGRPHTISSLLEQGSISTDVYDECVASGVQTVCLAQSAISDLCVEAIGRALTASGVRLGDVECVVVADSGQSDSVDLLAELQQFDRDVRIIEPHVRDCASFSSAIESASDYLLTTGAKTVLVLLIGRSSTGAEADLRQFQTALGDGAIACVVSKMPIGFEIAGAQTRSGVRRGDSRQSTRSIEIAQKFGTLELAISAAYKQSGIDADEIAVVFGTHGSDVYLELIAEAAQVPRNRVYASALPRYGHIAACDGPIALCDFLASTRSAAVSGQTFCLIGWSPAAAGVVLLRAVGKNAMSDLLAP